MPLQKALFKVVGMYCTTCKPIVEKQLKGEQGIKRIDIDFMTDIVIVEYDPSMIISRRLQAVPKPDSRKIYDSFTRTSITVDLPGF
jgi:copper chaperone